MKFLITGGAGFIGSTVASAAEDAGHEVVVLDNFVTGRREFIGERPLYEGTIADADLVRQVFRDHPDIYAVLHCAALIVVPDSVEEPLRYYRANVVDTLSLVETLVEVGCTRMLFSSSASIYQTNDDFSVDEDSPLAPLSPYARTKAIVEEMLRDISAATDLNVISLRYFNPIGADPQFRSGLQLAQPSHALGKLIQLTEAGESFAITGTDYPTRDGSGVRDYVHVWDLAAAHVSALEKFDSALDGGSYQAINLGTGQGTTVRELIAAFENVLGRSIQATEGPRRPGDSAGAYTRSSRANRLLGWKAERSVEEGIADTLAWFERRGQLLPDLARN